MRHSGVFRPENILPRTRSPDAMRGITALLLGSMAIASAESFPNGFVGPEACAPCHAAQYGTQKTSRHALALRPIGQSTAFKGQPPITERDYSTTYETKPDGVQVRVDAAGKKIDAVLQWAFGAGAQGITPVGIYGGQYFEHRYSYYSAPRRLAPTFGHPKRAATAEAALGVLQDGTTISRCFNCHATGVQPSSSGPDLQGMLPGITCERCHGPGAAHVAAAKAGAAPETVRRSVVNPKRFPARAQVQMCGECHRLPPPEGPSPEPEIEDPVSVRLAPIGLMASRCFTESKQLACVTCHDPHADVKPRTDLSYTEKCLGCHAASSVKSKCPRPSDRNCVSCHMPQAALGAYLRFTDHRIRVR